MKITIYGWSTSDIAVFTEVPSWGFASQLCVFSKSRDRLRSRVASTDVVYESIFA